jgi:hypothetical protein
MYIELRPVARAVAGKQPERPEPAVVDAAVLKTVGARIVGCDQVETSEFGRP